jgi:hypothetical protein
MKQQEKPITKKEEVKKNPDKHIDQDFPGYPHSPSKEKTIKPQNNEQQAEADMLKEEKKPYTSKSIHGSGVPQKKNKGDEIEEQNSDGSASAFEGTEELRDDE